MSSPATRLMKLAFRSGANRAVLILGAVAFKFARHRIGARCNLYEADLYRRTTPKRREMLCPVLACAPFGLVLIARAAQPLTADEAKLCAAIGRPRSMNRARGLHRCTRYQMYWEKSSRPMPTGRNRGFFRCNMRTIKGHEIAQFKDMSTQVVVAPSEYASGEVIYPYERAK